jgi:hypothetical protein
MRATRGAPAALEDPRLRATGALVATLFAQRQDWVLGHAESVELRDVNEVRRRVAVEFELPAVAWGLASDGAPAIVPLGLVPKASSGDVSVRDGSGERVAVVPEDERDQIAAAGLLAIAAAAGAGGDALSRLVWAIVTGPREEAREALTELARGGSDDGRLAWMHPPFRVLAEQLADHAALLVALPEANAPRKLAYEYDDRATPFADDAAPEPNGGLAGHLRPRDIRVRVPVGPLAAGGHQDFEVDAGDATDASFEIDEPSGDAVIHVTAAPSRAIRLAPLVALAAALLLAAESLAAASLARNPGLFALALAVPLVAAAYVARHPDHPVPAELLRSWRALLLAVVGLCLAGQVMIAVDASEGVLRVGAGVLAGLSFLMAAWLFEAGRPRS